MFNSKILFGFTIFLSILLLVAIYHISSNKELDIKNTLLFLERTDAVHYNIMFVETNNATIDLTERQLCAIESAARNNPSANVVLYKLTSKEAGNYSRFLDHYPNLVLKSLDPTVLFADTPLLAWYQRGEVFESEFSVAHLADAARLALLYKLGGFYSDLDTICLKSLEPLIKYNGPPYFTEFGGHSLGSSHLVFRAGHPFLAFIIKLFAQKYDPKEWAANGPFLLVQTIKEYCQMEDIFSELMLQNTEESSVQKKVRKCDIALLPEQFFYPYSWEEYQTKKLFEKNAALNISRLIDTYSIHLFGRESSAYKVKTGDNSVYEYLAAFHCPLTYNYVKINHLEF